MKKYSRKTILRKELINKSGECPIVIRYTYDRKSVITPLELTIKPENWDEKECFPIQSKVSNFRFLSKMINQKEEEIDFIINEYFQKNKYYPSVEVFKRLVNNEEINETKPITEDSSILTLFNDFINHCTEELSMSVNTIKIFKSCKIHFEKFQNSYKNTFLTKDINKELLIQFRAYLSKRDLQNSSINKYIKYFKIFINQYLIERKELTINLSFRNVTSSFENDKEKIDVLTEQEVEDLKRLVYYEELLEGDNVTDKIEVTLTPREKQIGRMFLFQCYTGISFSDLLKLSYFDIHFPKLEKVKRIQRIYDEVNTVENDEVDESSKPKLEEGCVVAFERQKTDNQCIIPIFGTTIELLLSQIFLLNNSDFGGWEFYRLLDSEKERIEFLKKMKKVVDKKIMNGEIKKKQIFPMVTNQNYNREIKQVFKKMNLNKTYDIKLDNAKKTSLLKYKWEIITSHTARRTYISLNINKGLGIDTIMRTTGHKNFTTLRVYVKQTEQSVYDEFMRVIQN
jgi:integrase